MSKTIERLRLWLATMLFTCIAPACAANAVHKALRNEVRGRDGGDVVKQEAFRALNELERIARTKSVNYAELQRRVWALKDALLKQEAA